MHVIEPTQDNHAVVVEPVLGVVPQVGVHPRVEVAAGGNGAVEPDRKITTVPLRNLQFASTMMLLARSYGTAIT